MKEVFGPQPVLRKNLSRIFKIHLRLLKISSGRRHGNTDKYWQKLGKVVFCVVSGIPDPPLPSLNVEHPGGVQNSIWAIDLSNLPWAVQIHKIVISIPDPPFSLKSGRGGGVRKKYEALIILFGKWMGGAGV
jgi:hypothetical protein